jgi:hypothetical protein
MDFKVKALVAGVGVVVVALAALLAWSAVDGGGTTKVARSTGVDRVKAARLAAHEQLEAEVKEEQKTRANLRKSEAEEKAKSQVGIDGDAASQSQTPAGEAGGGKPSKSSKSSKSTAVSSSSFADLENEVSGEIGVAFASLGSPESQTLGPLQVGHAWSSFKVPISVTVMSEQGGSFNSSQEALVASAITASDNEAAAALFSELESMTGGGASGAVEQTLAVAGAPTEVATAPPPPGAVSSWGQTEWPLASSTRFYNALACGAYGGATATILGDMENVIPEQQWGLGQAGFPGGTSVAYKAGWGPDGSESGPYLVRQAGIIRSGNGGAVVTIAAQDSSGSFEAGVADLDRVADWVAQNVPLDGSC